MDEQSHLEQIRSSPGNVQLLREYAEWLAANDDPRGEYLETELAFRAAETRIQELRLQMYELTVVQGLDLNWLDIVHPLFVTAITAGTFYTAPAPGQPPFVSLGDPCDSETIVGILEIMRVPNQIASGCAGFVSDVVVMDGQSVKGGDVLMKLVRTPPNAASS